MKKKIAKIWDKDHKEIIFAFWIIQIIIPIVFNTTFIPVLILYIIPALISFGFTYVIKLNGNLNSISGDECNFSNMSFTEVIGVKLCLLTCFATSPHMIILYFMKKDYISVYQVIGLMSDKDLTEVIKSKYENS